MFISQKQLQEACTRGIITEEQAKRLVEIFSSENKEGEIPQRFNLETVLYYGGSLIALGAMTYYMYDLVHSSTYTAILILSIIYSLIFYFSAEYMWKKSNKTPAGLLYILFILSVSYVITVITKMTGLYPKFSQAQLYENFYEASKPALYTIFSLTIFTSIAVLKKRPLSILTLPVVVSLYSLGSLFIPDLLERIVPEKFDSGAIYSFLFSLIALAAAFKTDKNYIIDYSKWLYIAGALMLYYGFTCIANDCFNTGKSEFTFQYIQLLFNIILIIMSILLRRKIFLFLGGIGFFTYLVFLEISYFAMFKTGSLFNISVIIITGLLAVFAGIAYKNNIEKFENAAEKLIPARYRKALPKYR